MIAVVHSMIVNRKVRIFSGLKIVKDSIANNKLFSIVAMSSFNTLHFFEGSSTLIKFTGIGSLLAQAIKNTNTITAQRPISNLPRVLLSETMHYRKLGIGPNEFEEFMKSRKK